MLQEQSEPGRLAEISHSARHRANRASFSGILCFLAGRCQFPQVLSALFGLASAHWLAARMPQIESPAFTQRLTGRTKCGGSFQSSPARESATGRSTRVACITACVRPILEARREEPLTRTLHLSHVQTAARGRGNFQLLPWPFASKSHTSVSIGRVPSLSRRIRLCAYWALTSALNLREHRAGGRNSAPWFFLRRLLSRHLKIFDIKN